MAIENPDGWLRLSAEIEGAISSGDPVVALESTVIAQGLPWPRNFETAVELETEIRAAGAVPATIAVIDGVARIGLTRGEIEHLAHSEGVEKLSTRDLPVSFARRGTGATTVAATSYLARRAGIDVFATGGIGGVHRGLPPDVSADLAQLQRTPIIVVCAGAKSILDLPATREMLEALGVLVLGYRTDAFPTFYSRGGNLGVDFRVEGADEVGAIWRQHRSAELESALLLCVPIPEAAEIPAQRIDALIDDALAHAETAGIRGKGVTPYLLARLGEVTAGDTTEANVALLRNNARIAARVAVEVAGG